MPLAADTRHAHLGRITEAWRDVAKRGRSRVVIVTGAPAAGKSRLVADALTSLTPAPSTVLIGHGRPGAVGPYDWTATAFASLDTSAVSAPSPRNDGATTAPHEGDTTSHHDTADADEATPISADALAWLTRRTDERSPRLEPTALRRAAITYVRRLTGERAAVLVAENAHALDPASLDLVTALATDGPTALLVVVARATDANGPHRRAHQTLHGLAAAPNATTLVLPERQPHPAGIDELVSWARYADAIGDDDASAGTLEAAAALLRAGQPEAARDLIDECLADDRPGGLDDRAVSTRLTLARSLLTLGHVDAARRIAAAIDDEPGAAELSAALRAIDEITSRERDVLDCIATGMTNQQAATTLGISIRTVTVHVSNVLRKTGTASRTEAALWAVQHGLVRPNHPGRRR